MYGDDVVIVGGVVKYYGMLVIVIGYQCGKDMKENFVCNFGMFYLEGYCKVFCFMKQVDKFNCLIICFIDMKGVYLGKVVEEWG